MILCPLRVRSRNRRKRRSAAKKRVRLACVLLERYGKLAYVKAEEYLGVSVKITARNVRDYRLGRHYDILLNSQLQMLAKIQIITKRKLCLLTENVTCKTVFKQILYIFILATELCYLIFNVGIHRIRVGIGKLKVVFVAK